MQNLSKLPIPLLDWFRDNARILPWRSLPTPYRVLVSEIMLQQTRVTAVLGYFDRFIEAFPTPASLAEAGEDKLMKLWQGLGYYSRARNLQKAARQIMDLYDGIFPNTYSDILTLSGVGEYTAGAIASIAFGLPVPAVDGNVLRVVARITGDDGDIMTPAMKRKVRDALQEILPIHAPGAFNQALMELGAMVCLPNGAPLCNRCPACSFCVARLTNQTAVLPVRAKKKPRRIETRTVFFIFNQGRVALRRRPAQGLLAGLWEFPCVLSTETEALTEWGISPTCSTFGGSGRHIFTHVEWHMSAYLVQTDHETLPEGWVWADQSALQNIYAVPSAFAPFSDLWLSHLN